MNELREYKESLDTQIDMESKEESKEEFKLFSQITAQQKLLKHDVCFDSRLKSMLYD